MVSKANAQQSVKKKFKMPHVLVILFSIIIIAAISTYLVPAGSYERVENADGRTVVVDGSYAQTESNPASFLAIFEAVHTGMVNSAAIIFYIFIVGGAFGILRASGAIEGAVHNIAHKLKNKEMLIIPILMTIFALGGAMMGLAEETIAYMTIVIPLVIMLGYDSMVGAAIILVGTAAGFTAAFMNPFTIGVAQGIAEIPIFSGMGLRIVFFVIFLSVSIWYVMRYAKKIKADPTKSIMYGEESALKVSDEKVAFETRHKWAFAVLGLTLVALAFGVIKFGWYLTEIAGLFLLMGVVIGVVTKMSFSDAAEAFIKGCETVVMGALIVGIANAILVVLQNGAIMDTILYGMASAVGHLPPSLTAFGMYMVQCLTNYIVPSGSGQAALTMPIMTPLADLVGVTRQTAVLAFQFGDGISNIFTPTSGYFMAGLAIAGISWIKWVRWIWPLILIQYTLGAIFVIIAQMIGFQ